MFISCICSLLVGYRHFCAPVRRPTISALNSVKHWDLGMRSTSISRHRMQIFGPLSMTVEWDWDLSCHLSFCSDNNYLPLIMNFCSICSNTRGQHFTDEFDIWRVKTTLLADFFLEVIGVHLLPLVPKKPLRISVGQISGFMESSLWPHLLHFWKP